MNKFIISCFFIICVASTIHAQTASVTVDAGKLENANGTAAVPVGGLLELVASPTGNFTAPTATSFISGDNMLVTIIGSNNTLSTSFAMNYSSGTTGETVNTLTISTANLTAGEELLLRWYPTLTNSMAATYTGPGAGTAYGQARSDTIEFSSDQSETAWIAPASGAVDLDYVTNGTTAFPNNAGYAMFTVPEPTTCSLLVGAFVSLLSLHVWNHRCKGSVLV